MPPVSGHPSKYYVQITWENVPHLDETAMAKILASTPPYLRDARSKGDPVLGAGVIYPVPLEEIVCRPFIIPVHYHRNYGMDVGLATAAVWNAWDPDTDVTYTYADHLRVGAEPSVNAAAIKGRGDWIPGAIDPSARARSPTDGRRLMDMYTAMGLKLSMADNAVSTGIEAVWEALSTGKLKVFSTCTNLLREYRIYRRDERGKVIKKDDHVMDGWRYAYMTREIRSLMPKTRAPQTQTTVADAVVNY